MNKQTRARFVIQFGPALGMHNNTLKKQILNLMHRNHEFSYIIKRGVIFRNIIFRIIIIRIIYYCNNIT